LSIAVGYLFIPNEAIDAPAYSLVDNTIIKEDERVTLTAQLYRALLVKTTINEDVNDNYIYCEDIGTQTNTGQKKSK